MIVQYPLACNWKLFFLTSDQGLLRFHLFWFEIYVVLLGRSTYPWSCGSQVVFVWTEWGHFFWLSSCVCKAQTKRRQIQPDLCKIISRSWEEEYLHKIIVKNESKQGWINWIVVAVDLVAVGDWMVLRPADRAVTLNDLGMEPLCLVMRGAISMEENGENSNFWIDFEWRACYWWAIYVILRCIGPPFSFT